MRAWLLHGNRDIRLEELADPVPASGEVSVRIAYNGLCGSDLHEYFDGPVVTPLNARHPFTGHLGPVTLGHEASGVVTTVGPNVSAALIGQQVAIEPIIRRHGDDATHNIDASFYGLMAHGFLADTAVVQARTLHRLPPGVGLLDGALTEPLSVAWRATAMAGLRAGQGAVVFGGGPIGVGSALSLRARGIENVTVAEPSPERRSILDGLGFSAIDPRRDDFDRTVRTIVGADGAHAVIDAAGVPAAITGGIELLRPHGRLVIAAVHSQPVPVDTVQLLAAEKSIHASLAYRDEFPEVLQELAKGSFPSRGWVDTVPFDDLESALTRLRAGQAVKLLVTVNP